MTFLIDLTAESDRAAIPNNDQLERREFLRFGAAHELRHLRNQMIDDGVVSYGMARTWCPATNLYLRRTA